MATQLSACNKEQCSGIHFLWAYGVLCSEIHYRIVAQYGENCMDQWKVFEWVEKLKNGHMSIVDEPWEVAPEQPQLRTILPRSVLLYVQSGE